MKLYIKNMVCQRCIAAVRNVMHQNDLVPLSVELGEVEVIDHLSAEQREKLRTDLQQLGFELFDDLKARHIEQIKLAVINLVHYSEGEKLKTNFSDFIAEKIGRDYDYLSGLFSEVEGITIEKYIILQRIERVKELLVYGELTLSEIAYQTGYSSLAHLSAQFKKITGLTPTHYREIRDQKRKPLDQL